MIVTVIVQVKDDWGNLKSTQSSDLKLSPGSAGGEREHIRSVELTAGLLYKKAANAQVPTRPEEGGR